MLIGDFAGFRRNVDGMDHRIALDRIYSVELIRFVDGVRL